MSNSNGFDLKDLLARLDELRRLPDGWLDGEGVALDSAGLDWLGEAFKANYPDALERPLLFPMLDGGVRAEWIIDRHAVSLDINLRTHRAHWHALNRNTDAVDACDLDLDQPGSWFRVFNQLRAFDDIAYLRKHLLGEDV